eukprot:5220464-Pleurochrysis_carterae.AAC.1
MLTRFCLIVTDIKTSAMLAICLRDLLVCTCAKGAGFNVPAHASTREIAGGSCRLCACTPGSMWLPSVAFVLVCAACWLGACAAACASACQRRRSLDLASVGEV